MCNCLVLVMEYEGLMEKDVVVCSDSSRANSIARDTGFCRYAMVSQW
jgi:hypothetical protein